MAHSVETDEIASPVPVGFLGAHVVVVSANDVAELAMQFWFPADILAHGNFPCCPYGQYC